MKLSSKQFREILFSDFKGKVFAILIACFLWYYVNILSIKKIYVSLPIQIINIPAGKFVDYNRDLGVKVEFLAHEDISRRIENIQAVVDLTDYSIGSSLYPIELINLPKDIVANIIPEQYRINIYEYKTKTVPVYLNLTSNKLMTNINFTPKEVIIKGSSQFVDKIQALNTESIKLNNIVQNVLQTNIKIQVPVNIEVNTNLLSLTVNFNKTNFTNEIALPIIPRGLSKELMIETMPIYTAFAVTEKSNLESYLMNSEVIVNLNNISNSGEFVLPVSVKVSTNIYLIDPVTNISIVISSNTLEEKTEPNNIDQIQENMQLTDDLFNYLPVPNITSNMDFSNE